MVFLKRGRLIHAMLFDPKGPFMYLFPSWCILCKEVGECIAPSYIWHLLLGCLGISGSFPVGCADFLLIEWADNGNKKDREPL